VQFANDVQESGKKLREKCDGNYAIERSAINPNPLCFLHYQKLSAQYSKISYHFSVYRQSSNITLINTHFLHHQLLLLPSLAPLQPGRM
jgi:hypothetical protein